MPADSAIMEALARIEHKVDLLLRIQATTHHIVGFIPVDSPAAICPVCVQPRKYLIDSANAVVVRKCGCSTGKVAVDLKALEPPKPSRRTNDVGSEDSGTSIEDRPDPNGGRGHSGTGGKQGR